MASLAPALAPEIIGAATDAIIILDENQRIVLFNPAAEIMFRCPAEAALGQPLDRFLPAHLRADHRAQVETFATDGNTTRAMGHLRPLAAIRADGEEFPIEVTIARAMVHGRRFVAAIIRDVGRRQEAEAALRREAAVRAEAAAAAGRDRLRAVLDALHGGVMLMDGPGAAALANDTMLDLIYGAREDRPVLPVYGRDFRFLRGDGSPLPEEELSLALARHGEHVAGQKLLLERHDRTTLPVQVTAAPLLHAAPAAPGVVVCVLDNSSLAQAEQFKDDFLLLVSHELRTPLTAIHGGAHVLLHKPHLDPESRIELLQDIVDESLRLDRLLSNLLAVTEILAGRLRVVTEPVLVAALVRRLAIAFAEHHPAFAFTVEAEPNAVAVAEADPNLVEEIVRNLYDNAVKYSPGGGAIRTSVTSGGSSVVVSVSDQGIGIAPEHVAGVFERFRRVGENPTVRGMGLGLYLSRALVEAQGGHIEASSPGLGHGATFTFTLPVAQEEATPPRN